MNDVAKKQGVSAALRRGDTVRATINLEEGTATVTVSPSEDGGAMLEARDTTGKPFYELHPSIPSAADRFLYWTETVLSPQ